MGQNQGFSPTIFLC